MKCMLVLSTMLAACVAAELTHLNIGKIVVPYRTRRQDSDSFVSFSAGLTQATSVAENNTVAFDKVWINTGNGYNASSGVFTCPHNGVYVFIYHGLSNNAGTLWMELYKNDDYQISGYAHNINDFATANNALLLELQTGDTVYIRGQGTSELFGQPDEIYSTFSGFILIPSNANVIG